VWRRRFALEGTTHSRFAIKECEAAPIPGSPRHVQAEGRGIVTLDLDFADVRRYPPRSYAGLMVFRLRDESRGHVLRVLDGLLDVAEPGIVTWGAKNECSGVYRYKRIRLVEIMFVDAECGISKISSGMCHESG
jgi:hypothetical protein